MYIVHGSYMYMYASCSLAACIVWKVCVCWSLKYTLLKSKLCKGLFILCLNPSPHLLLFPDSFSPSLLSSLSCSLPFLLFQSLPPLYLPLSFCPPPLSPSLSLFSSSPPLSLFVSLFLLPFLTHPVSIVLICLPIGATMNWRRNSNSPLRTLRDLRVSTSCQFIDSNIYHTLPSLPSYPLPVAIICICIL